jgi:hypothetical protein
LVKNLNSNLSGWQGCQILKTIFAQKIIEQRRSTYLTCQIARFGKQFTYNVTKFDQFFTTETNRCAPWTPPRQPGTCPATKKPAPGFHHYRNGVKMFVSNQSNK